MYMYHPMGHSASGLRSARLDWTIIRSQPQSPAAPERSVHAATGYGDPADLLAEALLQRVAPRHELEAQTIVDHREPPTGNLGRANQLARDIVAGGRGLP